MVKEIQIWVVLVILEKNVYFFGLVFVLNVVDRLMLFKSFDT